MTIFETYTMLFVDTLVSNFAFNSSTELSIHAMKIFGHYNGYLIIIISSLAFMISSCVNYIFGMACYKILSPLNAKEGAKKDERIKKLRSSPYLPLMLMLSAIPFFGKFVMLFSGFCKIPPIKSITIGSGSRLVYYSLLMWI